MAEQADRIHAQAQAWLVEDPDPATRAELQALMDAGDDAALADRFGDRLQFGTAGMRGALGAGPNRMNRALVRRVTAGLAARLLQGDTGDPGGIIVGRDARHGSEAFAADTVAVLAGAGIAVQHFPDVVPTPLLAYAVRTLGADAGVMVTASHNPPADNGYKVYAVGGRQIIPPLDGEISAAIDAVGPLADVRLATDDDPLIGTVDSAVAEAYVRDVLALVDAEGPRDLRIVYTAMHGVGGAMVLRVLGDAGFADVSPVPEQQVPDADFPTVAFPNPEEPGAMDLAIALATELDADLILANDPDADRIAVGVRDPDAGGYRLLSGDEIGVVLAEDVLVRGALAKGRPAHVGTTVVSSTLLSKIAAHHGAGYVETLTGFKWLSKAADDLESAGAGTLVLGYEQALGVSIGDLVRDKDGISAALAVADLAARLKADSRALTDLLDDLAVRHGAHVTVDRSVMLEGRSDAGARSGPASPDGEDRRDPGPVDLVQTALDHLRAAPPTDLGGSPVIAVWDHDAGILTRSDGTIEGIDLPPTPLLRYVATDGTSVMVRPSGTEPKLKFYGEAIVAVRTDVAQARSAAAEQAAAAVAQLMTTAGLA